MTKKVSLGITVGLIIISIVLSSFVSVFALLRVYDNLLVELPQRAQQYEKLSQIDELIRNEYYGDIDSSSVNKSLVSGFIEGLNDPYCYYISAENFEVYSDYLQGKLMGTGINSYFDNETGMLTVSFVDEFSPAFYAGIEKGFYISEIDGVVVTADNAAKLSEKLNDGYNKKITVSYLTDPNSEASVTETELNSGYRYPSCEHSLNGEVGYVHISSFYEDTCDDFLKACEYFRSNNVSALILDLRNCTGNDFEAAAKLIDAIVPVASEGTKAIYTAKNADDEVLSYYSSDASTINMSVAVLVNSRTESAAELVACDLRDFGKAVLIGEKTAGHGTMQKVFTLEDGGAVSLTVAEIYPYISDSFDGVGINPDFEIITSEVFKNQLDFSDFDNDEQYKKAYSYLTGK